MFQEKRRRGGGDRFTIDSLLLYVISEKNTTKLVKVNVFVIKEPVTAQKCFTLRVSSVRSNPQKTAELFTFTEEVLNVKLNFLCSEHNENIDC